MTTRLQIRTIAALLHQGQRFEWLGWLAFAATLWACIDRQPLLVLPALLLVVAQRWFAFRVGFDAALLDAMAAEPDPDAAAPELDGALQRIGLRRGGPDGRGWDARWLGMRSLLRWQLLVTSLQLAWLLATLCLREWQ